MGKEENAKSRLEEEMLEALEFDAEQFEALIDK